MPMFLYSCSNCSAPAKKAPLKPRTDWKDPKSATKYEGLGGWRCTNGCGACKVKRDFVSQLAQAA